MNSKDGVSLRCQIFGVVNKLNFGWRCKRKDLHEIFGQKLISKIFRNPRHSKERYLIEILMGEMKFEFVRSEYRSKWEVL